MLSGDDFCVSCSIPRRLSLSVLEGSPRHRRQRSAEAGSGEGAGGLFLLPKGPWGRAWGLPGAGDGRGLGDGCEKWEGKCYLNVGALELGRRQGQNIMGKETGSDWERRSWVAEPRGRAEANSR